VHLKETSKIVRYCKVINILFLGWNHLGMDEYMSDKAKKMKAQIE